MHLERNQNKKKQFVLNFETANEMNARLVLKCSPLVTLTQHQAL